ncbi:unnamed protein product [Urochloa humidicola]
MWRSGARGPSGDLRRRLSARGGAGSSSPRCSARTTKGARAQPVRLWREAGAQHLEHSVPPLLFFSGERGSGWASGGPACRSGANGQGAGGEHGPNSLCRSLVAAAAAEKGCARRSSCGGRGMAQRARAKLPAGHRSSSSPPTAGSRFARPTAGRLRDGGHGRGASIWISATLVLTRSRHSEALPGLPRWRSRA